ncbi:glycine cleavage system aminomethyltransferase GcvT [Cohnella sp. CFH 77786]|uniref:glycine cleavage system aminomethyltransferase GcvT n=1 Tax=Cohnella sp. CFH 77786 TaxID=2662265 RepID=UPI001C60AA6B|nr:glycine cleavage system aminomethyltransferase GcvT [Cohnella sp. CFH 77786]MBW5446757.1 glycine cleavage system aminomethyltransferase GcvT [Cohnella sp. CFH 77786]
MSELLRTPLYDLYREFPDARCIDFGGWDMPVQFSGIQREHEAVRTKAGLFDVSHMGEFAVEGPGAAAFLQRMTTNDVDRLVNGQAQYSLICNPDGGVVDDLLVYKRAGDRFMLVVNASNTGKDFEWLGKHLPDGVTLNDRSREVALLAVQGPHAERILARVTPEPELLSGLQPFRFLEGADICGRKAIVSRTGYTGEDGFELYVDASDAATVWRELLGAGEADGLVPVGLGARDTLRFEARLPLYGQELSDTISPLEAGLGAFVKLDKGDFVGREALIRQKAEGLKRKLVGIEMADRGIPRALYPVYGADGRIGEVTTGTQSPTLKRNLGLALIDARYAGLDTEIEVDIRGKRLKARVVPTPFYRRTKQDEGGGKVR